MYNIESLLALYLIQLTSFTSNTVSKQMKEFVYSNRIIQHIINFIFIFILISIMEPNKNLNYLILNTSILYLFYILSTKMDLQFNLLFLIGLLIYYFYNKELKNQSNRINNDNDLDNEFKEKFNYKINWKKNIYSIIFIFITLLFSYIYFNRKNVQYGGKFNYANFFIY